jgi:hypothetical protein
MSFVAWPQRVGLSVMVLALAGWLAGNAGEPPLTAEQCRDLEKQAVTKEKEAIAAEHVEDLIKARTARQTVLELRTRIHGAADWRVVARGDKDVRHTQSCGGQTPLQIR